MVRVRVQGKALGLGSWLECDGAGLPVSHGGGDLGVDVLPVDHLGLGVGVGARVGVWVELGVRFRGRARLRSGLGLGGRVGVTSQLLADVEEEGGRVLEARLEGEGQLGHLVRVRVRGRGR